MINLGFNYLTFGAAVIVGLQFKHFGLKKHRFKQFLDPFPLQGGNLHKDGRSTPIFGDEIPIGKLLLNPVRIGFGKVALVDRHDDGNSRLFGMVNGFYGLGHDAVISGHHEDYQVGNLGPPGSH